MEEQAEQCKGPKDLSAVSINHLDNDLLELGLNSGMCLIPGLTLSKLKEIKPVDSTQISGIHSVGTSLLKGGVLTLTDTVIPFMKGSSPIFL